MFPIYPRGRHSSLKSHALDQDDQDNDRCTRILTFFPHTTTQYETLKFAFSSTHTLNIMEFLGFCFENGKRISCNDKSDM